MNFTNAIYRPNWTNGRYHHSKTDDKDYAIIYNTLEGYSFFFENESAILIGHILSFPKGAYIPISSINDLLEKDFNAEEITSFLEELISVGILVSNTFSDKELTEIRKEIGLKRRATENEIIKSVQEKLPIYQSSAENLYLEILEKDGIPFVVMLELTYNCNEKCVHCFNPGAARNDTEKSNRTGFSEIDVSIYRKLIVELKQLGVVKVILTGGDPFVKKDIWGIIELLYEHDFAFEIYTNGLAIVNKVDRIASFFPKSIGLSVYSASEDVHDSITRVPNSLKKTLFVAEQLMNFGVPMNFKCPIMQHNATSYYTIVDLAKKYGAIPQIDITLTDSVDGDTAISEQLQVKGDLLEIILRDENIPLYVGKEAPNWGKVERDRNSAFCGAGTSIMNITPDGYVTPCNSFPTQFGNLLDENFSQIWRDSKSLKTWQNTFIKDYEECGTHERCGYCNRCPGQSFIEHGTPLKASRANCDSADARMKLAKKLQAGEDPLNGYSIQEAIQITAGNNIPNIVASNKENINHRNREILF